VLAIILLLIAPAVAALVAALIRAERARPWVLPGLGLVHLVAALVAISHRHDVEAATSQIAASLWLRLDALGSVVLLALSVLFLLVACYAPGYLTARAERKNRVLVVCMCLFLGLASLATLSQHLGLMWAAIEGATLASAPMIYFNHNPRSIEATWKYLMVGGVGLALALLGTFFLAYAAIASGTPSELTFESLIAHGHLSEPWVRVSFVLLLVGYGTKMGLAPMHSWKPDAYGETPGMVGALLAGGMTSIAFLVMARVVGLVEVLGQGAFAHHALTVLGLLSMAWAAVFMIRQTDIKRMLAYSSVEHMGILAVGLSLGPVALPAVLLHLLGNTWAKGALFISAGNIHRAFGSKHIPAVGGAILRLPVSATIFLLGFLAATGTPPFALFISEFGLCQAACGAGRWWTAGIFLACLVIIFIGFSSTVLAAVLGDTDAPEPEPHLGDSWWTTSTPIVGLTLVLLLGLWIPSPLKALFDEAAAEHGHCPSDLGVGGSGRSAQTNEETPSTPIIQPPTPNPLLEAKP
jgi:hydrogenase-4 component F